jgi:pimeloyl-ACP methyl ester carboxylesterase
MKTFVLIHGAWHGGWCWKRVVRNLRARGHEVYAPSLTGAGARKHLLSPEVGMDTYTQDVVNLIESEDLNDVILVGHSAAGVPISKAAESIYRRLRALVYIDAVVLPSGKSMFDVFPPQWVTDMRGNAEEEGQGYFITTGLAMIMPFFASDFDEDDKRWLSAKMTAQAIKPYEDTVDLDRFYELATPRTYIHCTKSQAGLQRKTVEKLGMTYLEIDAGHDPMISQPEALAALLADL